MTLEQEPLEGEWTPDRTPITQEGIDELKGMLNSDALKEFVQESFDKLQSKSNPTGLTKIFQGIKDRFKRK